MTWVITLESQEKKRKLHIQTATPNLREAVKLAEFYIETLNEGDILRISMDKDV